MNTPSLQATAQGLFSDHKGLLAMDESVSTCNRRFTGLGIPQTEEARRSWRELLITTRDLGASIGGAILCDETIRQKSWEGTPFTQLLADAGIMPGIKVDLGPVGLVGFASESITEGLDGLAARTLEYAHLGARFAKWRAVIVISDKAPTAGAIDANAHALARYAAICQSAGLVPIVEPEVLMDGSHDLARCEEVTEKVLVAVFDHLRAQRVLLEGIILKPNMVLAGSASTHSHTLEEVADASVQSLLRCVPAAVPAVAFLSGGQTGPLATGHLNCMNLRFHGRLPWALSFSFARAIQQNAMQLWNGQQANLPSAQRMIQHRISCCRAARQGLYDPQTDTPVSASLEPTLA